jgi:tetratricopeptide (TPR) repeat protein
MIVQKDWFLNDVEGIKLNNNLYGETDTPIEVYNFYQKYKISKEYELLIDEIEELIYKYNRAECYALKGDLYKKILNNEQAFDCCKKAIECNPNNAAYYSILGREYLKEGMFYETIDILSYLIEHNDLQNYDYYVSYREFRLIAACCVGKWDIAKEDIDYIPDDFIIYTKPVNKKITKKFLEESIKNRQKINCVPHWKI